MSTMNKSISMSALGLALAIAVGGATSVASFQAQAQFVVVDPTNYVQNFMTQLRAVQSNVNEVKQIQQQIEAYKNMVRNTESLLHGDIDSLDDAIYRLGNVLDHGKSLSVGAQDFQRKFQTMFPGYQPGRDFHSAYSEWNTTTRDSVLGAMRVAQAQVQGVHDENTAIAELRSAVHRADGQKAAIDAANQIALNQVRQMQGLRELMVAQMQAEGTYMAAQAQEAEARRGVEREMTRYHDPRGGVDPKKKTCFVPPCK